jgi:ribokinase
VSGIVVLGSANLDLSIRQARQPRPGETIFGTAFAMSPGGKGLNQAIAAARAGADVAFIGSVGDDAFGRQLREALATDGIDVACLRETHGASGTAHVSVLDGGENSIVVIPGANGAHLALSEDEVRLLSSSSFVVAQLERPAGLVEDAFRRAREQGATTVLTPAPADAMTEGLLGLTDVLIPNAGEARLLAHTADDVSAARSLSNTVPTVVVTRGSRGVIVARAGDVILDLPARRVPAIDTTGAGDTFAGVLVARLSLGAALEDAVRAATVAASLAVTRHGASPSMPRWPEIAELIATTPNDGVIPVTTSR